MKSSVPLSLNTGVSEPVGARPVKKTKLVGNVTQRQLAELAGVSMTTIYNCLHAKELVNKETLKHVFSIIKEYDYHPNSIAQAMVWGKSKMIGIIIPRLDVDYYANIVSEFERLLYMNGYNSIICQHLDDTVKEEREIRFMREKRVDGIIVRSCGSRTNVSMYQRIAEMELPFVLLDRSYDGLDDYYVGADDCRAFKDLTEYLIEKGHRRIGYIGWERCFRRERLIQMTTANINLILVPEFIEK